jgi:dipeptidyl aminopeptidase/acylaminoacyl peptidase
MKKLLFPAVAAVLIVLADTVYPRIAKNVNPAPAAIIGQANFGGPANEPNSLSIEYMRSQEYPGSEIVIEQTLPPGSNYNRYIASYKSDGLKIYALLTVPTGTKPETGWPVIIFNHGYIPPEQYRTTERYLAYTDAFSRNGYIVFKSDYRGNGNSEGTPGYPEYSPAYTIDILNAISSIKKYPAADPNRIGMWGHSMGGTIVLRSLVVSKGIKAAEIWAGVVGTFQDLSENRHGRYTGRIRPSLNPGEPTRRPNGMALLTQQYGDFKTNPAFWNSIDPMSYLKDINAPVQLQHSTTDEEVPFILSQKLDTALKKAGRTVVFYSYEGDDHNLSGNLNTALQRSVDFFDKYLKRVSL